MSFTVQSFSARVTALGATVVVVAAALVSSTPAIAAPTSSTSATAAVAGAAAPAGATLSDIDGDGQADLVVGAPGGYHNAPGRVWIRYATGRTQTVIAPNTPAFFDSHFGVAVLVRDFNGDGYADLAVGAPGYNRYTGTVIIFRGGPSGVSFDNTLSQFYGAPHSGMGYALAYVESTPRPILAVGAPYDDDGRGAVSLLSLNTDGTINQQQWLTQNTAGVPGSSERGDQFGSELAASGSALVVGIPFKKVGSARDAGRVMLLSFTGGLEFQARAIDQNSPGVPDKAERGDNFGSAVAAGLGLIVVGVRGESFGKTRSAGAIQVFTYNGGTSVTPWALRHQDYPGIPGTNADGDGWGSSLAMVRPCPGKRGVVVGAPYDTVRSAGAAGSATMVTLGGGKDCYKHKWLRQGSALGDAPAEREFTGQAVAIHRTSANPDATDQIVIGIPGENDDRGKVTVISAPYTSSAAKVSYDGSTRGGRFGAALNQPR